MVMDTTQRRDQQYPNSTGGILSVQMKGIDFSVYRRQKTVHQDVLLITLEHASSSNGKLIVKCIEMCAFQTPGLPGVDIR
jgi:hypothetical protein